MKEEDPKNLTVCNEADLGHGGREKPLCANPGPPSEPFIKCLGTELELGR